MSRSRRLQLQQVTRSPPNILKRKTDEYDEFQEVTQELKRPCHRTKRKSEDSSNELVCDIRSGQLTCTPFPRISWGNHAEVWKIMVEKDNYYKRKTSVLANHPSLHSRMRAILLDWLIEVCEVYRLHRDSYYLALDFADRFLASQQDIPKQSLQLIGITALFISTKLEEIYPPKLKEFAYVTDGACTETEILDLEFIMLKNLNWDLTPITANSWLTTYLQLLSRSSDSDDGCSSDDDAAAIPRISGQKFLEVAQLLDLCMLDEGCHQFSYRIIAAGVVHYMVSPQSCLFISKLNPSELSECLEWLVPFYQTVINSAIPDEVFKNSSPPIKSDERHMYQAHCISLDLLDKAQAIQQQLESGVSDDQVTIGNALTPPISTEKYSRSTTSASC